MFGKKKKKMIEIIRATHKKCGKTAYKLIKDEYLLLKCESCGESHYVQDTHDEKVVIYLERWFKVQWGERDEVNTKGD